MHWTCLGFVLLVLLCPRASVTWQTTSPYGGGAPGPVAGHDHRLVEPRAQDSSAAAAVATPGDYTYRMFSASVATRTVVTFLVQAPHDAYLLLSDLSCAPPLTSSEPACAAKVYEIVLGGNSGTTSSIRTTRGGADAVLSSTPGVISSSEYRPFWVSWEGGAVSVGQGTKVNRNMFMFTGTTGSAVNYVGVTTGLGASGLWVVFPVTCGNYSCPSGYTAKDGTTGCPGLQGCNQTDCCMGNPTCSSSGYVCTGGAPTSNSTAACASQSCTQAECCGVTCGNFSCFPGYPARDEA
eukprot:RCo035913